MCGYKKPVQPRQSRSPRCGHFGGGGSGVTRRLARLLQPIHPSDHSCAALLCEDFVSDCVVVKALLVGQPM